MKSACLCQRCKTLTPCTAQFSVDWITWACDVCGCVVDSEAYDDETELELYAAQGGER